jgi:hypothetical protein
MARAYTPSERYLKKAAAAVCLLLAPLAACLTPVIAFGDGIGNNDCAGAFDDPPGNRAVQDQAPPDDTAARFTQGRAFLGRRASNWVSGNKCLSCHTVLPYMLSQAGGPIDSETANTISQYIGGRMNQWGQIRPWYTAKAAQSKGTELILSAQALSQIESSRGQDISPALQAVLGHLQAAQLPDGSWDWLDYGLEPWESKGGKVFGSTMAALALANPKIKADPQYREMSDRLRGYLKRADLAPSTTLLHRLSIIWADSALGGILTPEQKADISSKVLALRNPDGGWSVSALGNYRKHGGARAQDSDSLATAFSLIALRESGAITKTSPVWIQGVAFLKAHQLPNGSWGASSLNSNEAFNAGLQQDAATGFALRVLSLDQN